MAQLATVLANTYLISAEGGPSYRTTVFDGATGIERRTIVWTTPRHTWSVSYGGYLTELADVIALHTEAQGQGLSFLWSPPGYAQGDFRFASDEFRLSITSGAEGVFIATVSFPLIEVLDE